MFVKAVRPFTTNGSNTIQRTFSRCDLERSKFGMKWGGEGLSSMSRPNPNEWHWHGWQKRQWGIVCNVGTNGRVVDCRKAGRKWQRGMKGQQQGTSITTAPSAGMAACGKFPLDQFIFERSFLSAPPTAGPPFFHDTVACNRGAMRAWPPPIAVQTLAKSFSRTQPANCLREGVAVAPGHSLLSKRSCWLGVSSSANAIPTAAGRHYLFSRSTIWAAAAVSGDRGKKLPNAANQQVDTTSVAGCQGIPLPR